jgi:hypothetical protein
MMFPKKVILGTALLLSAGSVLANTADLRVIGTIAPPACTPTFAGGGVVDYSNIAPNTLGPTTETALMPRNIAYTISCDSPIPIAASWSDARSGTAVSGDTAAAGGIYDFGLNSHNSVNIGRYTVTHLTGATGDGNVVHMLWRTNSGSAWVSPSTGASPPAAHNGWQLSFTQTGGTVPRAYTTYAGTLQVQGYITPRNRLNLSTEATLDGLTTMTVSYL